MAAILSRPQVAQVGSAEENNIHGQWSTEKVNLLNTVNITDQNTAKQN